LNQIQKDSNKIIHPLQNSIEQPSNMKMRPKIMVKNQNNGKNIYQNPITNENINFYEYNKRDSRSNVRNLQETPQINEMKLRKPKILQRNEQKILEKINSHHGNEHILQKVGEFHKKHENKIGGFKEGNEEDFKEVSIEKEIDSEQRILLEQALKRQEQDYENEGIDTELLSKKKKII